MAEEERLSETFVRDTFVGGSALANVDSGDAVPHDPFVSNPATGDVRLSDPTIGDPFVDATTVSTADDVSGSLGFGGGDFV